MDKDPLARQQRLATADRRAPWYECPRIFRSRMFASSAHAMPILLGHFAPGRVQEAIRQTQQGERSFEVCILWVAPLRQSEEWCSLGRREWMQVPLSPRVIPRGLSQSSSLRLRPLLIEMESTRENLG
jgi:hypothetical protein